jgi:hypothetical protein
LDMAVARQLWDVSEKLSGTPFPALTPVA